MTNSKLNIYFIFMFLFFSCYSQNQNNNWLFGFGAGLTFTSNPPTPITASTFTPPGGCSTISDAAGNLLFYTDGATIWNQSNTLMSNGSGLWGTGSGNQKTIILKQPGNTNLYYLFTINGSSGSSYLKYSVVDMNLSAGQGSVAIKNVSLSAIPCDIGITATKHCNGNDYWIIIRDYIYNTSQNAFHAYQLTSSGISSVSVSSSVSLNGTLSGLIYGGTGYLKSSLNGKKLAASNSIFTSTTCPVFELFDFDNSTGLISNHVPLLIPAYTGSVAFGAGVEFSPDGTKLYGAYNPSQNPFMAQLLQWNLCAGNNAAIVASQTLVGLSTSSYTVNPEWFSDLRLAPNGKIYLSPAGAYTISVINNPNLLGTACNFVHYGQSTAQKRAWYSFPNFCNSILIPHLIPPPFTYTPTPNTTCHSAQFSAPAVNNMTTIACSITGYSVTGYLWNFGDPASGSANTTGVANPTHAFSSLGTYTTQLILYYSCGGGTDTLRQVVNITQPCVSVNNTSITCANLGSATVTPLVGLGPYTYTWLPSSQIGSVASGLIPGTYTVLFYDPSANYTFSSSVTLNPLIPLTGNVSNSNSVSCNGASTGTGAVTNIIGGSAQQYFSWFNGITSYTSSSTNSLSAGLWTVSVTDALTACSFSNTIFISQPSAQNLILSASSTTACNGSNIVLSGTNSGGTPFSTGPPYTYTWTNGPTSNTNSVSEATSGTYIYTLSSSDANSCLTSNTIALNFIPNPTLSVSNLFICPLSVGTLTVSGATNYTWASTSLSLTGNTFTDAPSSSQQYTVVGEMAGCSSQAVASIVLYNNPIPTLNANSPLCNGDQLIMSGLGGISFQWSGPNAFSSNSSTVNINPVSNVNAGVYTLTVTATTGCTASVSQTIVVNPTPTLSAGGSTVCTSQTLHLSASSFTGSSYEWSGPTSFTSTLQNPIISNPLISNTGTYTVKVTSVDGCTNTTIATASVINPPSLTTQLSSNTLCSQAFNGSPNTITLTAGGANMYTLVTVPDMNISNPSLPSTQLTAIPPNTGVASATLSGSNSVCTVTTSLTFTILPNPTVSIISPTPVICAGQTYTYTNQGATSYTWSNHAPGVTTYSTGQMAVLNPSINSVFSVVGGSLGCFSTIKTTTITVNPLPIFSLAPISPTICLNSKVVLNANGNATSYNWSPFTGLNSVSGTTVLASPTSLQSYTAIGSLNTCTSTAFITVSVVPLPNPIASTLKPELCLNEVIILVGKGGIDYIWHGPADLMYAGQTVTFVASNPSFSGTYTLTVSDENGCKASNHVGVKINLLPSADLLISQRSGCIPFTSYFKFNTPGQTNSTIDAYWQLGNQTFTDKQFLYNFTSAGTYSIFAFYTDTLTTCKNKGTFFVEAFPLPLADFTYEPKKPVEGLDEVSFINTSSGESLNKFNWYFINNNGYHSQNENTSYLFHELGEYPVAMVVQNKWGCSDTITKAIKIESDFNFYVPNAFTPNDDNLNDVFLPVVRGVKLFELMIFDRWGKMIFSTNNTQQGWDGYYNGEPAKQDVYTWKVVLSTNSGDAKVYTGQVLLTR